MPRQTCASWGPGGAGGGPPRHCGRVRDVTLFPILYQSLLSPRRLATLAAAESSSSASCLPAAEQDTLRCTRPIDRICLEQEKTSSSAQ